MDGIEFMHSHGPTWLDIRLSKKDQESVLKTGEALPHRFAPQAGWVSFRIEGLDNLNTAKRVIMQAYENAKKNLEDNKSRTMQQRLR